MSRRRTTFGKLQRDRDKQAKAKAKIERRAARAEGSDDAPQEDPAPQVDQTAVLDQLAKLHAAFDDGKIGLEDFEARRDELTSMLRID
ncbi:MAG TPA: hypothetical protein VF743_12505 [Acidimicrobiales bacterium]